MLSRVVRISLALALLLGIVTALTVQTARAAFFSGETVYVTTNYLNLRSNPGTDGTVRDVLIFGNELTVIEGPSSDDGFLWYKVRAVDINLLGWVAEDYIARSTSDSLTGFEDALGVVVIDGPLNVRAFARTSALILTTLATDFEVPVNENLAGSLVDSDGYTWINILYGNGLPGWVATEFLSPLAYSPNLGSDDGQGAAASIWAFDGIDSAYVSDGPVNMRDDATTGADILITLETGDYLFGVEIVYSGDEPIWSDGYYWVFATAAGFEGYIATDFLTPA